MDATMSSPADPLLLKVTADLFEKMAGLVNNLLSAEAGEQEGLRQLLSQARAECRASFVHDPGRSGLFDSAWTQIAKHTLAGVKKDVDLGLWLDKDRFGHFDPCWIDLASWRDDPRRLEALADCYRQFAEWFRAEWKAPIR
jgi:hypothetical protein